MSEQQQTLTNQQAIDLALQHHKAGRLFEAERIYQQILQSNPNQSIALHLLGVVAYQKGKNNVAVDLITKALTTDPAYAEAHCNLGLVLQDLGKLEEAIASYRHALAIKSDYPEAHNNLGKALHGLGKLDEAKASYGVALALKADYVDAHYNQGNALLDLGKFKEAIAGYRKALAVKPNYPEAHNNLGNALQGLGKLDEAKISYGKALALKPDYAEAHYNQGNALQATGKPAKAVASYHKAIKLKPDYPEAYYNLGNALMDRGKLNKAVANYQKALALKPDFADAHNNLGNALKDLGRLEDAVASYHKVLSVKPDYAEAHSNLILAMSYTPGTVSAELFDEARRWNIKHGYQGARAKHQNTPEPERRLRVGLVSGDLRHHSVSYFLETILLEINKKHLDMFAYATSGREDDLTNRLKSIVPKWRNVTSISDERLAEDILADGIDILVDLSGHTRHNRLKMFSHKPAPLQVTWLGYPGTTGIEKIDYILCDRLVLPPTDEAYFAEKPWRLPDSWFCFTPPDQDIDVGALPALRNGSITFGSFNNLAKISNGVVACWARILQAVPNGNLLLKALQLEDTAIKEETKARFAAHGISCRRLILKGRSRDRAEHLRTFHKIDIALDPFPYPGGRTSAESLWMGIPVLTLRGDRFVSHIGESLLHNMDLGKWIADTPEDYVGKALVFATDLAALSRLRESLRNRLLESPICDADRFTRNLETAFREMWREWCAKKRD